MITSNVRDFPQSDLGAVRRLTPDEYFTETLSRFPDEVLRVLEDMGSQRREPQPFANTLQALRRAGLTVFVATAVELLAERDGP